MRIPWKLRVVWQAVYVQDEILIFRLDGREEVPETAPSLSDGETWHIETAPVEEVRADRQGRWPPGLRALAGLQLDHAVANVLFVGTVAAAWGFTTRSVAVWPITETGTALHTHPADVTLTAFETQPAFRGRKLYQTLLASMLRTSFADGAPAAHIWCRASNAASRAAIERVGFRPTATHQRLRVLGVSRRRVVPLG